MEQKRAEIGCNMLFELKKMLRRGAPLTFIYLATTKKVFRGGGLLNLFAINMEKENVKGGKKGRFKL